MYAWIRIAVWNVVWRETLTYFCDVGSLSHMHYYPDNTQTPECSGPGARLLHQSLMHEYRREEDWRRMQITKEEEEEWHLTRKMKRASFSAHWQKDWQIQEKLMCGSTALMYCNKTSGVWKLTISDGNNTFLSHIIYSYASIIAGLTLHYGVLQGQNCCTSQTSSVLRNRHSWSRLTMKLMANVKGGLHWHVPAMHWHMIHLICP